MTATTQDLGDRTIRFIVSDETVDRDGDTVSIDGWDLSNYQKNPVVLYGHDKTAFPVARAKNVYIDRTIPALVADVSFPSKESFSSESGESDAFSRSDAVFCMAKSGLLNAVSAGFKPIDGFKTNTGKKFNKQELLEISIVPVQSNRNALAILRSAGHDDIVCKGVGIMESEIVEKAGKRLSNESKAILKECHETLKACHEKLGAFLDQDEPDEPDEKPTEPSAPYLEIKEKN